jgi:serine/threonine protein kinase/Tol biopolymer transport system component
VLETKTQLGRYVLRSQLGAGGMGEVYVAHDPKIGRDVAIKVLSAAHSTDSDRIARFEQEAQAAGSLNHPNIVSVYDVDMNEGTPYVVSELLHGETLRTAIGGTALPIRKAFDYALQITSGLAAAHERGIIHRDLKPENIFVTSDGRVKILDFGLAKLLQTEAPLESYSDASTREVSTDPGTVMGTMGYMSPEQLRGQQIDARTDIFSFGAVFYEMLTGRRAFQRESTADTISAVLREELPDLSETNKNVRAGLDKLVHRCLAKNREQRFHSASDLAFALDAIVNAQTSDEFAATIAPLYSNPQNKVLADVRNWAGWIAAAALLAAVSVLGFLYLRKTETPATAMRFALPAPEQATFGDSIALSPNGRQVVFTARGLSGEDSLWIRSIDAMDARQLQGTAGAAFPFWSPDSRFIAFFALGKLRKIEASGGMAQILADASTDIRGGSWSKDNVILFTRDTSSPLFKISATGGTPVQVTNLDQERGETSHRWPSFLPDGNHFLYYGRGNRKDLEGVFVGSLDSNETKFLFHSEIMAAYAPSASNGGSGHLLFVRSGSLLAQPFDPSKFELSGEAVTIAEDVVNFPTEVGATGYAAFSTSQNGHLLYRSGGDQTTKLAWFDRRGKEEGSVTPPGIYREPRLSPDGKKILFVRAEGISEDLNLLDESTGAITRLTFGPSRDVAGVWSPDGNTIAFASTREGGNLEIYQKAATGAGTDERIFDSQRNTVPDDWTKDGAFLLFDFDAGTATKNDLMLLPATGERKPVPYLQTQFSEFHARFSPDGRWVAYTSDETGRPEVFVRTYPDSGGKWQISANGGDHPQWGRDGRELFFMAPDRDLKVVPINAGSTFEAGKPTTLFETKIPLTSLTGDRNNFLVSADGQRFLINSLADERNTKPLTLVLNWEAEKRK